MKTIAFVGLPNTGKSSWIHLLTNQKMDIANYSGVTVEMKKIFFTWHNEEYCLIDVPGAFSVYHQKDEEKVLAEVLNKEKIDVLIQIINSTQLRASLGLTLELRHLQIPMICVLNFKDEADKNNIHIDTMMLSRRLSLPVMMASALNLNDADQLMRIVEEIDFNPVYRPLYNPETDRLFQKYAQIHALDKAISLFESHYPKLVEDEKHRAIESCMSYVRGTMEKTNKRTYKIDEFLIGCLFGKILLISGMLGGFLLFLYLGLCFSEVINELAGLINQFVMHIHPVKEISSFLNDVIFSALGSLLSFVPLYVLLSFYFALIEESGLMARFLVISEKMMRFFHLNGKSLISMILAHGCNVAAVTHISSFDNVKMKKKTVLLIPFCSCSARLPVYLTFASHFFGKKAVFTAGLLIVLGILSVLLLSELIAVFFQRQDNLADIVELPTYRKIHFKVMFQKVLYHSIAYFRKLLYVLLAVFTVIYILMKVIIDGVTLFELVSRSLSVLFIPLGFGLNWVYVGSLIPGVIAKEAVVGTFTMLLENSSQMWISDPRINLIYLVYISLTVPCVLTCHAISSKFGLKMMISSILFSLIASYMISWLLYQFIMFF